MPIKKDETGKHWVEMEVLVPGTPEQVWRAIATGPGYAAWFVPAEVEPRVGGSLRFDFGQGTTSSGEVTTWKPPLEFGDVERDWCEGAPPVATEITITARSGDRCVLRMVHSLFTSTDDWDSELEGFEQGWLGYFALLRAYLTHFADTPAMSFTARVPAKGDTLSTWQHLCAALQLSGASVGVRLSHRVSSTPAVAHQSYERSYRRPCRPQPPRCPRCCLRWRSSMSRWSR
jgi:uncharacterized protein YndB with AHSA1/START domain